MASSDDNVPDSTDWLSTPLSGFAAVEAALRCQVCKDLYKTPMITSCSHTFCSICIRRALSNDGKCPMCRASEQELKLRSNWSMEETVEAFSKARAAALSLARSHGLDGSSRSRSPKRKASEAHVSHEPKRLRTSARLSRTRGETGVPVDVTPSEEVEEQVVPDSNNDDEDDDYVPDAPNGLVPCPLCNKKMKEWQVFGHLESCPGPSAAAAAASNPNNTVASDNAAAPSFAQSRRKQQRTLERLPPLNYSMLKEQALRKKMSDLGISSQGPRVLLEKRHKEWLTLWNANCDAAIPKKRSELLHDLDAWERTQGGRAPTMGRVAQTAAAIKDKDFDGAAWAARHDSSFRDLIASARRSRQEAATKKTEEADQVVDESSSQPPDRVPPTMDGSLPQQGESKSEAAPGLESVLPPSHAEPMSWELSQRPIGSTPSAEGRIGEADKY
ncbi:DNA repair protein rad18 [Trichoderma citrinoviride]|uniref:Postreplication repair E3 ubiquitin-protein ligase RAD18 n=1 Tax=Trichoderma citrinoviride TaxID=58853 RepID=A0A2T4BNX7_9HYPO|nr:DNA repair protein rad18 [Trichoderma citrinoviride]PTB71002.1 DNA repair protein rad18 [Trichoderma citrinoviride]